MEKSSKWELAKPAESSKDRVREQFIFARRFQDKTAESVEQILEQAPKFVDYESALMKAEGWPTELDRVQACMAMAPLQTKLRLFFKEDEKPSFKKRFAKKMFRDFFMLLQVHFELQDMDFKKHYGEWKKMLNRERSVLEEIVYYRERGWDNDIERFMALMAGQDRTWIRQIVEDKGFSPELRGTCSQVLFSENQWIQKRIIRDLEEQDEARLEFLMYSVSDLNRHKLAFELLQDSENSNDLKSNIFAHMVFGQHGVFFLLELMLSESLYSCLKMGKCTWFDDAICEFDFSDVFKRFYADQQLDVQVKNRLNVLLQRHGEVTKTWNWSK